MQAISLKGKILPMKLTSIKAFEKHIEGAEKTRFSSLYLIVSEEGRENRTAIDMLTERISKKEKIGALGIKRVSEGELAQEIDTPSFFSDKQILIGEVDRLNAEDEAAALKGSDLVFIILSGASSAKAFYRKVEKEGVVLDLAAEKSWQKEKGAEEWVHLYLAKANKKIERDAAIRLVKETRGDTELLKQELEKLLLYIDAKNLITLREVLLVVSRGAESNTYELGDALFKKERALAIKQMRNLLDQGVAYFAILKSIRSQIETDLKAASILRNGGSKEAITALIPFLKGYILDKHLENIRLMGFERLKKALIHVDDYELKGKDGSPDYELLSDLFVARFP